MRRQLRSGVRALVDVVHVRLGGAISLRHRRVMVRVQRLEFGCTGSLILEGDGSTAVDGGGERVEDKLQGGRRGSGRQVHAAGATLDANSCVGW